MADGGDKRGREGSSRVASSADDVKNSNQFLADDVQNSMSQLKMDTTITVISLVINAVALYFLFRINVTVHSLKVEVSKAASNIRGGDGGAGVMNAGAGKVNIGGHSFGGSSSTNVHQ